MNIPLIVDIAVGLIFIYLILSLLASEIQELITTLLQWRAEHLKKSIEVLIAGGTDDSANARQARALANSLYDHPLLRNLNQEAKGLLAQSFRRLSEAVVGLYRRFVPNSDNVFDGKSSGPSYIPAETFARTLVDTLKLKPLAQALTVSRVERFKQDGLLGELVEILNESNLVEEERSLIEKNLKKFAESLDVIVADLQAGRTSLEVTVDRMSGKLNTYVENCKVALGAGESSGAGEPSRAGEIFLRRRELLRKDVFGEAEKKALLLILKPTLTEVIQVLIKNPERYAEFERAIQDKDSPTYKVIAELIDNLPASLKQSLAELADRVKSGDYSIDDDISNLQKQIETWFDRSMERASGVYKRNAKGVAILMGLVVSVTANADTLYIVNSLSKDSVLRAAITENAEQVVSNGNRTAEPLEAIKTSLRKSLEDVSMPVGWSAANKQQQDQGEKGWPVPYIKRILGWLVSGLAIAMGSSFWFDLLSKVMNVRNIGKTDFSSKKKGTST
jgi:hypothetical protein